MTVPKSFSSPEHTFGDLDPGAAATLVAAVSDIALVIDRKGVIRDLALGNEDLIQEGYGRWVGRRWTETVTVESLPKVESLLLEAGQDGPSAWRQVNHPSARGLDVPILYSAMRVGSDDQTVLLGRNLRTVSVLQQRLVEAQQSMERDYAKLRNAETRYRLLFQIASEAVLIVDAATLKIVEANPAAGDLVREPSDRVVKRNLLRLFAAKSKQAIEGMLSQARAMGAGEEVGAVASDGKTELQVAATLFRQENNTYFLVRLAAMTANGAVPDMRSPHQRVMNFIENAPDAFVVTDTGGRILTANPAFLDLAQLPTKDRAEGETLDRWLGRSSVDSDVLLSNLREHQAVRLFATTIRGEQGASTDVEVSAVAVDGGEHPCFGFTIRNVHQRLVAGASPDTKLPRSVEQLTELVGRISLKEIVRETVDAIERLCIEAALELTGDNRASAAEMLGLSRQSLYVKLRRYGLGDLAAELPK